MMKEFELRIILTAVLMVLSGASGLAVRLMGRPLNKAVFGVHKLLGLAFAVFAVLLVWQLVGAGAGVLAIVLTVLSALLLLLLFVTGGILGVERPVISVALRGIHRATPLLMFLLLVWLTYLGVSAHG